MNTPMTSPPVSNATEQSARNRFEQYAGHVPAAAAVQSPPAPSVPDPLAIRQLDHVHERDLRRMELDHDRWKTDRTVPPQATPQVPVQPPLEQVNWERLLKIGMGIVGLITAVVVLAKMFEPKPVCVRCSKKR